MRSLHSFNLPNPSSRTMAVGLTQPLTENEYQKIFLRVKRGRRVRLTTSMQFMSRLCKEMWEPRGLTIL
jgi:hypothetical protein